MVFHLVSQHGLFLRPTPKDPADYPRWLVDEVLRETEDDQSTPAALQALALAKAVQSRGIENASPADLMGLHDALFGTTQGFLYPEHISAASGFDTKSANQMREAYAQRLAGAIQTQWPKVAFLIDHQKTGMIKAGVPSHFVTVVWDGFPDAPDQREVQAVARELSLMHPACQVFRVRVEANIPRPEELAEFNTRKLNAAWESPPSKGPRPRM